MGVSLFKRSKPLSTPVAGDVYQRVIFNTVETAHVISVTQEGFPVPHVRYISRNELLDGPQVREPRSPRGNVRTLTVESFTQLYGSPRAS